MEDWIFLLSIISSFISIMLALFAIWFSLRVEKRLKKNFLHLKTIMDENHDRTKEVLSSLNDEAYAIKKSVSDSQEELSITLEKFMIECGINKK